MGEQRWRVGELADQAGMTVRTLHHFDQIGLLRPAERSPAGHRLYTAVDVRRLYRIIALRQLGMGLAEIAAALEGDTCALATALRAQLAQVDDRIGTYQGLRDRLRSLVRSVEAAKEPPVDQLLDTMEAMMAASYFTSDQLAQARHRHQEPGFADQLADWQQQYAQLDADLAAHAEQGTDPADPAVQAIARRFADLITQVGSGDRVTVSAIYAKIDGKGPEAATRGALSSASWTYLKRAFAVGFTVPPA
jgi:MerR family transcriptional regulator, thiopeptide resistance regulator